MEPADNRLPCLITMSLSHFCEKARWGLDYARVPYTEQRHVPLFHALAARRLGGKRSVPILATADGVIGDSSGILLWANARAAAGRELYPDDATDRAEVLALQRRFDEELGPHIRRTIYFHLLPLPGLALPMLSYGVPRHQRLLLPWYYRPLRGLMRKSMRIDAAGAQRSFDKAMRVIDDVSKRLSDGRRFLVGGRFSAADLSFAALLAPAAGPAEYAVPLPQREALPAEAAALIKQVQETPAAAFCLRLYREQRR